MSMVERRAARWDRCSRVMAAAGGEVVRWVGGIGGSGDGDDDGEDIVVVVLWLSERCR